DRPGGGLFVHPSIDQIVARAWRGRTSRDSLALLVSQMGPAQNPTYGVGISQKGGGTVHRPVANPAELYRMLFGDPRLSAAEVERRVAADRSLLDGFLADAQSLRGRLPASDRMRLDEYMENLRSVERRIGRTPEACERPAPPRVVSETPAREDL